MHKYLLKDYSKPTHLICLFNLSKLNIVSKRFLLNQHARYAYSKKGSLFELIRGNSQENIRGGVFFIILANKNDPLRG